jgi:hypothetical protein
MRIVLFLGLLCAAPQLFSAALPDNELPDAILRNLSTGNIACAVRDIGVLKISPHRLLGAKILHPVTAYYARKALAESEKGKEVLTAEALRQYYKKENTLSTEESEAFVRELVFLKYVVICCISADLMCISDSTEQKKAEQLLESFKQKMAYHTSFSAGYLCARTDIEETAERLYDVTIRLQELFESERVRYSQGWILFCTNSTYVASLQYGSFTFEDSSTSKLRIQRMLQFPGLIEDTHARALQVQIDELVTTLKDLGVSFPQKVERSAYIPMRFSPASPSQSIDWSLLRTPTHYGSPRRPGEPFASSPQPVPYCVPHVPSKQHLGKPFDAFQDLFPSH